MVGRIKLGELLVRAGVLDDFKLKAALAEQQRWGGRLGRILVEMNFVSEDLLVKALSKQLGVPRARLDNTNVPQEIVSKIDPQFAANNAICPERYFADKKTLVVAMADPTNVGAIDELRFKTGLRIDTSLAGELEITQAIDRVFYGRAPIDGLELNSSGIVAHPDPARPPVASTLFDKRNAASPPPVFAAPAQAAGAAMHTGVASHPPPPPVPASGDGILQSQSGPRPPRPGPGASALEVALALDAAQKKQVKAIRIMLELLIEKGVFSRDEYINLVNKR